MPQPSRSDLLQAADDVLASIDPNAAVDTVRRNEDAAYVAYVFGLILRAADIVADPGTIKLRSIREVLGMGANPSKFIIRGAPGYIHSAGNDYGFAEFKCNSRIYEIHLGVRYFGSSRVLHEFDISILDAVDAHAARGNQRNPSSGNARIVFECKFYGGNIGIGLGREFVGLLSDFSSAKSARLVTNSSSTSVRMYLTERVKFKINEQLIPGSAEESLFVNSVADDLRSRLR
jgi:hypothetical protein